MATYLFSVPLLPGKTETWKNYMKEVNGPRNEEYRKSRKKNGVQVEQVSLQHTPDGDVVVARIDTDNINRVFEYYMKSKEPFDVWFREKILMETHGMEPTGELPKIEKLIFDYQETGTREYVGAKGNRNT